MKDKTQTVSVIIIHTSFKYNSICIFAWYVLAYSNMGENVDEYVTHIADRINKLITRPPFQRIKI